MSRERITEILLRVKDIETKSEPECRAELNEALNELLRAQIKIAHIYEKMRDYKEKQKTLEMELRTLMVDYINSQHDLPNQWQDDEILVDRIKESLHSGCGS